MATITFVEARQIFDSLGNVTVEVDVHTSTGVKATAAAPTGASTGIYEALELGGGGSNYLGKGVLEAVGNVNSIIGPALIGKDPTQQTSIDNFMVHKLDRTQKLEANAILAVSLAVCKAGSVVSGIPLYKHIADLAGIDKSVVLPIPAFNVINADNKVGFMILPVAASSFKEALDMGVNVFTEWKPKIAEINASYNGDEEPPNI